jgi:hypothetical protein
MKDLQVAFFSNADQDYHRILSGLYKFAKKNKIKYV